jgi:hypothetical protein
MAMLVLLFTPTVDATEDWLFPNHQISAGYVNKQFFYLDVPHPPSPIFWVAKREIDHGGMVMYQHLLFHNQKRFSLYLGTSVSRWVHRPDTIDAISLFISLRYWFFRTDPINIYLTYSVAGPTLMDHRIFGDKDLGSYFIFQDFIGLGLQIGQKKAFNLALRLVHYSNGDIFPRNPGFDVPLVLYLGYSF